MKHADWQWLIHGVMQYQKKLKLYNAMEFTFATWLYKKINISERFILLETSHSLAHTLQKG